MQLFLELILSVGMGIAIIIAIYVMTAKNAQHISQTEQPSTRELIATILVFLSAFIVPIILALALSPILLTSIESNLSQIMFILGALALLYWFGFLFNRLRLIATHG